MTRARRARKLLGGAMRQAGVVAAAGIVALQTGVDRLADDHRAGPADRRGPAIGELGLTCSPPSPVTNFVLVDVAQPAAPPRTVVAELQRHGINASSRPPTTIRFVTHRQIGDDEVATLIKTVGEVLGERPP